MTTTEAPFCSLPAEQLAERLETIRREIVPHVTGVEPRARGVTLELEGGRELHARLARLVELERECCSGLAWELRGGPDASRLALVIDGIDPGALERLGLPVPAGSPAPGVRSGLRDGSLARLARAGAAGVVVGAVVCCVLPVAAAAIFGAAVAGPLAGLDRPPVVVLASLGAGLAWWVRSGRRAGRDAGGCGC